MARSSPSTTAPVDVADVAARLRLSVTRLSRRLRREAPPGHSPTQMSALVTINAHGPLTLGALADHERVAPPSVTKVVAKLEGDGLVERAADANDGRVMLVSTTKAGRDFVAESRRRKTSWLTERVRELSPEEQARLADALEVLEHLTTLGDER